MTFVITCYATQMTSDLRWTQVGGRSLPQFRATSTASAASDNAPDTNEADCHACRSTY